MQPVEKPIINEQPNAGMRQWYLLVLAALLVEILVFYALTKMYSV